MSPFLMHPIMRALYHRSTTAAVFNRRPRALIAVRSFSEPCSRAENYGRDEIDWKFESSRNLRGRVALDAQPRIHIRDRRNRRKASSFTFTKLIRDPRWAHTERLNMKLIDLFARGRKQHPDETGASMSAAHDRTDRSSMADLVRLLEEHDEAQSAMTHREQSGRRRA